MLYHNVSILLDFERVKFIIISFGVCKEHPVTYPNDSLHLTYIQSRKQVLTSC